MVGSARTQSKSFFDRFKSFIEYLVNPTIPFYRDIRVLRILAQVVFGVLFIGGIALALYSLNQNLKASDISLDFGVYKRPFGPAISEGLSESTEWTWIQDQAKLENIVWIIAGIILVVLVIAGVSQQLNWRLPVKERRWRMMPLMLAAGVVLLLLLYPPSAIAADLKAELPAYLYPSSITRGLITGIYNTLRVVIVGLIAATILGILVGIGLLSRNFLVRNICKIYVEIFRNTPLLIQLFFIYRLLTLVLPFPRQSIFSPEKIGPFELHEKLYAFNARGFYFAWVESTDTTIWFYGGILVGIVAGWLVRRWRLKLQEQTGQPANVFWYALPLLLAGIGIGWLVAGGYPLSGGPFTVTYPALRGPNIEGGMAVSIAFGALFLGLTLYTAAFIADIVRAGIQSVPYGQIEAARSQGFSNAQVLNLIVLPQALRLIMPPLGNQYINLGKNSSLGVAVTYVDTFRAAQIANNEQGQAVPLFAGLMLIYLTLSLTLSLFSNLLNRLTKVRAR
jgi:general L-amino acid transport system permease protein